MLDNSFSDLQAELLVTCVVSKWTGASEVQGMAITNIRLQNKLTSWTNATLAHTRNERQLFGAQHAARALNIVGKCMQTWYTCDSHRSRQCQRRRQLRARYDRVYFGHNRTTYLRIAVAKLQWVARNMLQTPGQFTLGRHFSVCHVVLLEFREQQEWLTLAVLSI